MGSNNREGNRGGLGVSGLGRGKEIFGDSAILAGVGSLPGERADP